MRRVLGKFTAIEYSLIAAIFIVAAVVAVDQLSEGPLYGQAKAVLDRLLAMAG